jgi:hypothetical protein
MRGSPSDAHENKAIATKAMPVARNPGFAIIPENFMAISIPDCHNFSMYVVDHHPVVF